MRTKLLLVMLVSACTGSIGDAPSLDPKDDWNPGLRGEGEKATRDLGPAPLRRLTQLEYQNSITEIFGVEGNFVKDFSQDEKVGPFSSNTVAPPQQFELSSYDSAAIDIAQLVEPKLEEYVSCDSRNTECAENYIEWLAYRTYRRTPSQEDIDALTTVFEIGEEVSFAEGIQLVTRAALNSPYFLYIFDWGQMSSEDIKPLDAFSLASRLSFFLWKSAPDEALLDAAADGTLLTESVLREQATRLLEDQRATETIGNFFLAWLHVEDLEEVTKNEDLFGDYTAETSRALLDETRRFVQYVIQEGDGKMKTLFTAPYSFPSEELEMIYGPMEPAGGSLPDDAMLFGANQRAGLLTQGSFLARHAHSSQSSPIHRGVVVRENVLCQPLPSPPDNVVDEPPPPNPNQTTRERFAEHTASTECASCHKLIDGIGFGFEAYNAIGQYNETENGLNIDDTGELVGTYEIDGDFSGAVDLSTKLSDSNVVKGCLLQQLTMFALGRPTTAADRWQLDQLYDAFEASDFNVRELLVEIAMSDAMRHVKPEAGQ